MFRGGSSTVERAARIARALSHPLRLQILDELREDGAYVMHLTAVLGRPQANISQHLMVLREAGLVLAERDGMTVFYRVRDPRVLTLVDHILELSQDGAGAGAFDSRRESEPQDRRLHGNRRKRHATCRCPRCRRLE